MQTTTHTLEIGDWNLSEQHRGGHSADQLIDAYLQGKIAALEDAKLSVAKIVSDGLEKSGDLVHQALAILRLLGMNPQATYLKMEEAGEYEVLIGVSEEDFLSDEILDAYIRLAELESVACSEVYSISFSLADLEGEVDTSAIYADGYIFKLNG